MRKLISALLIAAAHRLQVPAPDEKAKVLAAIVWRNDEAVRQLTKIVANLAEWAARAGDDPRANRLSSDVDQLAAGIRDDAAKMDELRNEFGLPPKK